MPRVHARRRAHDPGKAGRRVGCGITRPEEELPVGNDRQDDDRDRNSGVRFDAHRRDGDMDAPSRRFADLQVRFPANDDVLT